MANFREIVTKAVVAKGKKNFVTEHSVSLDRDLSTILGCWVINHLITVGDKHLKNPYMTRT